MKIIKILYVIMFALICFVPLLLMPFFKSSAEIEKRELTKLPAYYNENGFNIDFSTQFESWFNDRLPLRAYMLSASNFLKSELFKAPSSNVIVGKDGWLFYESEVNDYINSNAMTDNQINSVGITLSLIEEAVNNKGGKFTFVAQPNKASVYDEYMPNNYIKSNENNLTRINQKLDEMGVTHVDMLEVMRNNKEKGIYHKRDSHWNYQGALIGYNAIMDSLNKDHKTYENASYKIEKNWRGDLDKLLYPVGGFMDEQYVYDIDYTSFRFEKMSKGVFDPKLQLKNFMSDKEEGDDDFKSLNNNIADNKKLFMARDSFGRALLPFFIDNYREARFKRTDNPDIVSIGENTDFVYEIVERNLNRVIATAPFLYAPKRDAIMDKELIYQGSVVENKFSNEGYGYRLYGILDDNLEIKDRIYIELRKENDIIVYEAFPICESKLLSTDAKNGYSLFINKKELSSGEYLVRVVIGDLCYNADSIFID